MTGFGRADGVFRKKKYLIEARSVNNKFCEISFKYPKSLQTEDFELKEIVRKKISRGKIYISITIDTDEEDAASLNTDESSIMQYYNLLKKIKDVTGFKEEINLGHILNFSDFFMAESGNEVDDEEFSYISKLLEKALEDLNRMKIKEGDILKKDILGRIKFIEKEATSISKLSAYKVKSEKEKIQKRLENLLIDKRIIDENRLELEVVLLADKTDITEEITRLKSHTKYFEEYSKSKELAGRRLNFLIQEINREINTIASKSMDAEISQKSVRMKEELEKIKEQLQNIE